MNLNALPILAAAVLFLAPSAHTQSFNIDVGATAATNPTVAYGGAADQPGFWNWVAPIDGSAHGLSSLTGAATPVVLTVTGGSGSFAFNNAGTAGDEQALMDDLQNVGAAGAVSTWRFFGLPADAYWVYTYAWAPDNAAFRTLVHVDGAVDPDQTIGGAWVPGQRYLQTFALHTILYDPAGGPLLVRVETPAAGGAGSVNGFQLVKASGVCDGEIHEYCVAKVNSAGCLPDIGSAGVPSATAGAGFLITASSVLCNKTGLLLYSVTGPAATPFFGGTLCLTGPFRRTPVQNSGCPGGEPCGGAYGMDFNAFVGSTTADPLLATPGTSVWAQYYSRDPGFPAPNNVGLTNALRFTMCP